MIFKCNICGQPCILDAQGTVQRPSLCPYDTEIKPVWEDWDSASPCDIERDATIMALRLLGEDPNTFSPETIEVMNRWRTIALQALRDITQPTTALDSLCCK